MGAFDIGAIGQGAAGTAANGIVGSILGLALEKHNDQRQINQQQKLTDMQLAANEKAADYSQQLQLKTWNETNYEAQMAHLKAAGLNPGLIYGMSGGGATTTGGASASGVSAGEAPKGGHEIMDIANQQAAQQAAQLALIAAQTKNIEADTANKEADTANKPLLGENLQASTNSLTQGVQNQKAVERLTNIQIELSEIEEHVKGATVGAQIYMINNAADKALQELNILKNDAIISENTWEEKTKLVTAQLANVQLSNAAQQANIQLTKEQTKQVIQSVQTQLTQLKQGWKSLSQKDQDIEIQKVKNELIDKGINVGAITGTLGNIFHLIAKQ